MAINSNKMTTQQVIRAILDAATEGDLVKAEKVLEDYAKEKSLAFFKYVWFGTKWELGNDGFYDGRDDNCDPIYISDDEVFNEFIQSQNT